MSLCSLFRQMQSTNMLNVPNVPTNAAEGGDPAPRGPNLLPSQQTRAAF